MLVNYYYSDALTSDTEGNLVQLCRDCAATHRADVQWAARGDEESLCELCEAANDRTRRTYLAGLTASTE
jgi:hypothetical protein